MKIVASLPKPYTQEQYEEFVVDWNQNCYGRHNEAYVINETETELQALGKDDEEKAEEAKQARIARIKSELDSLDLKSIRAIRANDQEYIEKYEAEAAALREELKELQGE